MTVHHPCPPQAVRPGCRACSSASPCHCAGRRHAVPERRLGQAAGRAAAGRRRHHDPGRRAVFERAGCGFSHVRGPRLPPSATQHRPELAGAPFEAMGVSLVFHPRNPYVPTVHMNVRMIAATAPGQAPVCWFGGGMDLTPYYGFEEDAVHFHATCRDALAPFGADKYPRFKTWCDEYFFLKHRNEQRGIGGVFFDDFSELGFDGSLAMMQAGGRCLPGAYLPIVQRRQGTPYGERERLPAVPPAAAMSNSTWCGTGARISACSRAGAPNRFCCPCRRWSAGPTSSSPSPARPRQRCTASSWCARTGFEPTRRGGSACLAARLIRRTTRTLHWPRRRWSSWAWTSCASSPPARPGTRRVPCRTATHRLAMARLAFAQVPRVHGGRARAAARRLHLHRGHPA
jgi:hypothetical protein